jgi:hypothetical protein
VPENGADYAARPRRRPSSPRCRSPSPT